MKRILAACLTLFVLTLMVPAGADAEIKKQYVVEQMLIDILDVNCQGPFGTTITVKITNNSPETVQLFRLTCLVFSECCQIDFTSVSYSDDTGLIPFDSVYKTIEIKSSCDLFERLDFKIQKIK